jgi:signal transduction histidine kinase
VPEVTICARRLAAARCAAHAARMSIEWRRLKELFGPLSLAAYVAWLAVWMSLGGPREFDPDGLFARGAMLLFLAAFIGEQLIEREQGRGLFLALGAVLALSALFVIAVHPFSAAPILLVLLAAMLAVRLDTRPLLVVLFVVNLALALILIEAPRPGLRFALISVAAYTSFQAFAALLMSYARRAEAMAEQLRSVNAELLATRSLLEQGARDGERLRLSRELHDVAGHGLTALKLNLGALARDPRQPDPERVALCAELADDLLQNLRAVVSQMRASPAIDLESALRRLAAPFPELALHLQLDTEVERIEPAEAILRTVQEGLTNAARHSGARNLWLVLQRENDRLRLELRDDGRGGGGLQPGSGLLGMRERLQALGGALEIEPARQRGLTLRAWLPAGGTA